MRADFISTMQTLGDFSAEQAQKFLKMGIEAGTKKDSIVFRAGQPCLKLWFIKSGILRAHRIINGRDITFFFFFNGDFAVDYESFLTERESPLFFEALTDCEYLIFSKRSILELYKLDVVFERFGRIMAEKAYISATDRLKQFQSDPLIERYEKLMDKDPKLFLQIPQYHIASYLGVKAQSLSRIKNDYLNRIKGTSSTH